MVIVLGLGLIKPLLKFFQCENETHRNNDLIAMARIDGNLGNKNVVIF